MPFTYSGGGGPVGNRYFLGVYPVFLFLTPPLADCDAGLVAAGDRRRCSRRSLLFNPFYSSFQPGEHIRSAGSIGCCRRS